MTATRGILFADVPAPWTPLSLSSLWGFWRADKGVTQSSNLVSSWVDQSPNAIALTQGTGANKPTLLTNFNTSYNAVQFASASSTVVANSSVTLTAGKPLSICVLMQNINISTDGRMCCYISSNNTDDTSPSFLIYTPNANQLAMYAGPSGVIGNSGSGVGVNQNISLIEWVCDGTHENAYKATTVQGSQTSASQTYGQASAGRFQIGAGYSSGVRKPYDGNVAFLIVTQAAMSSSDRSNLKTWCNSNWGTSF